MQQKTKGDSLSLQSIATKALNVPSQEQLTQENLKLKLEIERLQSIVKNYQIKETTDQFLTKSDDQDEQKITTEQVQQQQCIENQSIENQMNNSTFILCNQLPSFLMNQIKVDQSQLEQSTILKENGNYFSLGVTYQNDDRHHPFSHTQKTCSNSFHLEGISEIRSSIANQNEFKEKRQKSGENSNNASTEKIDDLQKALEDIKNQEKVLRDLICMSNIPQKVQANHQKSKKSYIDKENLDQKLQESEKSILQIRELCKELEREKIQLNNIQEKNKHSSKLSTGDLTRQNSLKRSVERQSRQPSAHLLKSPINKRKILDNSLINNCPPQGTLTQLKRQNISKVSLRAAGRSLTRNVSQANCNKQEVKQATKAINNQLQSTIKAAGVCTELRSNSQFQSRRPSRHSIKPNQQQITTNAINPIINKNQLKKTPSKPVLNIKTQTMKTLNLKQVLSDDEPSIDLKKPIGMQTLQKGWKQMNLELSPTSCHESGKSILHEKIEINIPDINPLTAINSGKSMNSNKNMFNCGDSNDLSKTEKSLLEEFKKFLQQQQDKKTQKENTYHNKEVATFSKQEQPFSNKSSEKCGTFSPNNRSKSINNGGKKQQQQSSMKHCLNCVQLLSRGLSTAFCKEHQYARTNKFII